MTAFPTPTPRRRTLQAAWAAVALVGITAVAGLLVLLLVHGTSSSTTIRGSGVAAAQTRTVAAFDGVTLAGSNNLTIHVGGKPSVVVHADGNLLSRITTRVQDHGLVIGMRSGTFQARSPMFVVVGTPSLHVLTLAGSGVIQASGRTDRLDITLAGSGDLQLGRLTARRVRAVVSGSGRIVVTATQRLDASITGSGAIVYLGKPTVVETHVTGSGAVTPGSSPQ